MTDMDLMRISAAILEAQGDSAFTFDGPSTVTVEGYTLLQTMTEPYGCECCGEALTGYVTGYVLISPEGEKIRVDV